MSQLVLSRRRAGVLLPLSALRSSPGGALDAALRWIDWLADAGFSVWQLLPLVPTGEAGSPYWSVSDRAGEVSLLPATESLGLGEEDFLSFRRSQAAWLDDYALFQALRLQHGGAPWWHWEPGVRERRPEALAQARKTLAVPIDTIARAQWQFDRQWLQIRAHARARGVSLFGDLPIYVAPDSVATWIAPLQFELKANGEALAVAGVPPDYFSAQGQRWGNPLYRWEAHQADGFSFWVERLRAQQDRFDLLRLDHFRGLVACWAIPADAESAVHGRWEPTPGRELLRQVRSSLPNLELVAEDLGVITAEVTALRHEFQMAGMRVLQFGFDGDPANTHLPHQHDRDSVVYTGTHDNDTTLGWYTALNAAEKDRVRRFLARADHEIGTALVRTALASVGVLAVLPAQDLLGLGSEARLNTPGTTLGNWQWQLPLQQMTGELAARLNDDIYQFGRK